MENDVFIKRVRLLIFDPSDPVQIDDFSKERFDTARALLKDNKWRSIKDVPLVKREWFCREIGNVNRNKTRCKNSPSSTTKAKPLTLWPLVTAMVCMMKWVSVRLRLR